jgi:hypothetical protein
MSSVEANIKSRKQKETEDYLSKIRLKEVFQARHPMPQFGGIQSTVDMTPSPSLTTRFQA